MSKLTATRHDSIQDRRPRSFAEVLNNLKQTFDAALDLLICGGRQLVMQEIEIHHEIPLGEHRYGTKRLRQVAVGAARLGMVHRGWKQTGEQNSLRAFEHRWPRRRDQAEGRNYRLPGN